MVQPVNDVGTYYVLDENLEPVACNRTEWEAFSARGGNQVATTLLGEYASVVTTFEGQDDSISDEPHLFMTMTIIPAEEFSEAEGHRTWREAEAAHRARVDEMKVRLDRRRRESEPQLDLV